MVEIVEVFFRICLLHNNCPVKSVSFFLQVCPYEFNLELHIEQINSFTNVNAFSIFKKRSKKKNREHKKQEECKTTLNIENIFLSNNEEYLWVYNG